MTDPQIRSGSLVNYQLVRWHLMAAGVSILLSMTSGFLYSLQFIGFFPFHDQFVSPGHVRLIHTNLAAYGWLVNGFTAMTYYVIPRLTGQRVWSDKLGKLIFYVWQLVLVATVSGFLFDKAQAIEWGETPTGFRPGSFDLNWIPVDLLVTVGAVLLIVQVMVPLYRAREQKFYVTLWYFTAGYIW
jgi:cytochrome c oxidase cbb3-type subunit 1